jgi:hypothetical protein
MIDITLKQLRALIAVASEDVIQRVLSGEADFGVTTLLV